MRWLWIFVIFFFLNVHGQNKGYKYGWCVYSFDAYSETHLKAMRACKPTMIRWFVEWDRHDVIKNGQSLRSQRIKNYKPFFELCAQESIVIIVQMWVKERLLGGDELRGTLWAKPDLYTNYPSDIDASYGRFVRELIDFMLSCGITEKNIIMEAWNEPDLLWGLPNTNPPNYHQAWKVFSQKGFNKWTGGSGACWQQLHQVLNSSHPSILWANSGVGLKERYQSWIMQSPK